MRVALKDLKGGTVLAENVLDPMGRLLLAAGTVLSERHIKILRKWGIRSVNVKTESPEEEEHLPEELIESAKADLAERFRHFERDFPAASEIYRIAVERRARMLSYASNENR